MYYIKLYMRFIAVYLKSIMEYRFSFFTSIFLQIFTYSISFFSIWILLNKFKNINGWTFYEIMFLYTLNLFSYALSGMFVKHPMLGMEAMVQQGSFDGILTKPINPLFHVIARQFEYTFAGHIILCIITFNISMTKLNISWSVTNIIWLILFVFGGVLINSAFMIIAGSLSFIVVKSTMVVETAIYGLRSFLDYPITIYDKFIQVILTFIFPYAFVNFFPAEYFLRKTEPALFSPILLYVAPVVGIILLLLSTCIWKFGINHYESTGS